MDRCQLELRRLQRELEAQQDLLEVYMTGIRSAMSPIHQLPPELLGEIFKYICCGDIGINCIISKSEKQLPTLVISGVCSRWYNVVNSMPVLWSSFGSKALDSPSTLSHLKLFLERSRLHPLDFQIGDPSFGLPEDSLSFLTATENSSRWRHVQITARESFIVDNIFVPLIDTKQYLPVLVSLNLRSSFDEEFSSFPVDCPALQSLSLNGVPLDLKYPRSTITYLNLECLYPDEISRVILHCPNIQVFEVKNVVDRVEVIPPPNISCNALKFKMKYGDNRDGRKLSYCIVVLNARTKP
ncbi:hypothetical protein BT96DRAFT_367176 [Gymnopus androsaceus JB14]|uniref:Uncharacterized protein n=1 Tax=Gymnopus androsaceus JB14 TaxID=1447944 RepID=A0A6A4IME7_9AGAR|nr:hypothetical protein BT96DRAFT_367176 [Gymnopus androsaceus JB14]